MNSSPEKDGSGGTTSTNGNTNNNNAGSSPTKKGKPSLSVDTSATNDDNNTNTSNSSNNTTPLYAAPTVASSKKITRTSSTPTSTSSALSTPTKTTTASNQNNRKSPATASRTNNTPSPSKTATTTTTTTPQRSSSTKSNASTTTNSSTRKSTTPNSTTTTNYATPTRSSATKRSPRKAPTPTFGNSNSKAITTSPASASTSTTPRKSPASTTPTNKKVAASTSSSTVVTKSNSNISNDSNNEEITTTTAASNTKTKSPPSVTKTNSNISNTSNEKTTTTKNGNTTNTNSSTTPSKKTIITKKESPSPTIPSPPRSTNSASSKKRGGNKKDSPSSVGLVSFNLQPKKNVNNSCCCFCGDSCTCGDDCLCSEELCQCNAFQIINSVSKKGTLISSSSCCSNKKKKNDQDETAEANIINDNDPLSPPPQDKEEQNKTNDEQQISTIEVYISGMTCTMCTQSVENAVKALGDGIHSIEMSLITETAKINYNANIINTTQIKTAIEAIGYDVQNIIRISNDNNDVEMGDDNDNELTVEERWEQYRQRQDQKVKKRKYAFIISMIGAIPILLLTMFIPNNIRTNYIFHNKNIHILHHTINVEAFVLWCLATPVQFICGYEFYKNAYYSIFHSGTTGMDVLVALGTTASYVYAMYGTWTGDAHASHFFETSVILIAFVLAGKWMQAAAVRKTSQALTQLMELQSSTAIKITPTTTDNTKSFNPFIDPYNEEEVDIQNVYVNDIVKVVRGASIPADGRVLYGDINVDESMVTGESTPVLKTRSSIVLGGTICNEIDDNLGACFIQVTGIGSTTALAQIIQLVQEAQTRTVPIQSFADQVSSIFVPVVCTISLITYLVWYALCSSEVVPEHWYKDEMNEDAGTFSLMFAIACLVISCPCALGLATPTAVMVGSGVGAKNGVLIKGGEALEVATKIETVIFDKTGTLTLGTPAVSDFYRLALSPNESEEDRRTDEDYLLWLLGSLERTSEHPLAKAIVQYAEEKLGEALDSNQFVQPTNFRGVTGRGASGLLLNNIDVAVGNRSFAESLRMKIPRKADLYMKRLESDGKTAILGAVNGKVRCVMGVSDQLKEDAANSIAYLRDELNIDVWMVTGDNSRTAMAIGKKLGLSPDRIISEALPAAKLEKVASLQAEGKVVAMVGDGVNDSPALAQADCGVSMGTGAEIATEASDMVLVKGHVADVCTAIHLSRAIFRRIKLNLVFSLLYNSLGIPIAAGVFYPIMHARLPPTLAALAMALSSISVVLSSLSLRLYKPPSVDDYESGGTRHRRRVSTTWDRAMESRESSRSDEEEGLRASLLPNDHLMSSEMTEKIDNRTQTRRRE